MNNFPPCPICKSNTKLEKKLSSGLITKKLEEYYRTTIDSNLEIIDYSTYVCQNCTFEFAFPFIQGSENFYNWISKHDDYYPTHRWEYDEVKKQILNQSSSSDTCLIDIGCGSGYFLKMLKGYERLQIEGLDLTVESCNACKTAGINAYPLSLSEFISMDSNNKGKYDFVTSFHCLEHIVDPISFLKEMILITKEKGSIFISTPYSPMSFEKEWFDPLNHPPHHMGRWNMKSYTFLANQLNLDISFFFPEAKSIWKRSLLSFKIKNWGHKVNPSIFKTVSAIIFNPLTFINHFVYQYKREKYQGRYLADVILVRLNKK